jgi:hypothetical protein
MEVEASCAEHGAAASASPKDGCWQLQVHLIIARRAARSDLTVWLAGDTPPARTKRVMRSASSPVHSPKVRACTDAKTSDCRHRIRRRGDAALHLQRGGPPTGGPNGSMATRGAWADKGKKRHGDCPFCDCRACALCDNPHGKIEDCSVYGNKPPKPGTPADGLQFIELCRNFLKNTGSKHRSAPYLKGPHFCCRLKCHMSSSYRLPSYRLPSHHLPSYRLLFIPSCRLKSCMPSSYTYPIPSRAAIAVLFSCTCSLAGTSRLKWGDVVERAIAARKPYR